MSELSVCLQLFTHSNEYFFIFHKHLRFKQFNKNARVISMFWDNLGFFNSSHLLLSSCIFTCYSITFLYTFYIVISVFHYKIPHEADISVNLLNKRIAKYGIYTAKPKFNTLLIMRSVKFIQGILTRQSCVHGKTWKSCFRYLNVL